MSRSRQRSRTRSSRAAKSCVLGRGRWGGMGASSVGLASAPMTRALVAVGTALTLLILGLGLVVYLTRDEDRIAVDNLLSEAITRAIGTAEDRGRDVDLGRIAKFDWDEVLLVDRNATRAQISKALGYEWKGDLEFQTGDMLIFLRSRQVARFADYRGEGRFEGVRRPTARFDRDAAVFRVRGLVIRPRGSPRD